MRIKLTYKDEAKILRQTPSSSGIWADCEFLLNQDVKECDGWVVFDSLPHEEKSVCDPSKTIFIIAEPPTVHQYNNQFLSQFAAVISPQPDINHPNVIYQHAANHWYVGLAIDEKDGRQPHFDYDALKAMRVIPKSKNLSIICSTKTMVPGHRHRLEFVEKLTNHFGSDIDVFGKGFHYVEDKWEALADYKYCIVLENSYLQHYWTEKISDTFLAATFPLYYGCPNLSDYFPHESFYAFDIKQPQSAIRTISKILEQDNYENLLSYINKSRNLVLDEYNMFQVISNLMKKLPSSTHRNVQLKPEWHYTASPMRLLRHSIKRSLQRLSKASI